MDVDAQKRAAAARALEFVRPGMRLGLGSGSTAKHFVELLAERVRTGLDVIGVPTSEATRSDFERIADPKSLAERLDGITGVVEHGLFIGLAHAAVLAGSSGVRVVERR